MDNKPGLILYFTVSHEHRLHKQQDWKETFRTILPFNSMVPPKFLSYYMQGGLAMAKTSIADSGWVGTCNFLYETPSSSPVLFWNGFGFE